MGECVCSRNTHTTKIQKVWTRYGQYCIKYLTNQSKCGIILFMVEKKAKRTTSKDGKKFGLRKTGEKGVQANQWTNSPQQNEFLRFYLDPEQEETWGNAYHSAIKAGYSESYANSIIKLAPQWIQQANNIVRLQPEHLKQALASIANNKYEKTSDRLQAIKMLGIDQGMFVQKQVVGHVNIEQALSELK